jgi:histone acetyltransferase (RNA polymerase elongator complex component)
MIVMFITSYPKAYQEEFIRDLFYAANTFYSALKEKRQVTRTPQAAALTQDHVGKNLRSRMTLEEEQIENRTASCRIIGLTLVSIFFFLMKKPEIIIPFFFKGNKTR